MREEDNDDNIVEYLVEVSLKLHECGCSCKPEVLCVHIGAALMYASIIKPPYGDVLQRVPVKHLEGLQKKLPKKGYFKGEKKPRHGVNTIDRWLFNNAPKSKKKVINVAVFCFSFIVFVCNVT